MLEIGFRLQSTAGHQRVSDTDGGGASEGYSDVEIIILLQEGIINDAKNVPLVIVPEFIYQLRGHALQLLCKAIFTGNLKALFQRRRYHFPMLLPVAISAGALGSGSGGVGTALCGFQ